jgi:signal transduction histidine kinase
MIKNIFNKKSLFLKFIFISIVISATAVLLGFFGTNIILSSRDHKMERFFVPETIRTLELLQEKTQLPIEDVVSFYNNNSKGKIGQRRPPIRLSLIKRKDAKFPLPEEEKTFLEIKGKDSGFSMFKEQVYNYDGENFLVFHFSPPPKMGSPRGPGGEPFPFMLPLLLTFIIMLAVVASSIFLAFYILKGQAQKAAEVLRALKLGDLKARFPISKIDEASELMLEFNQMAAEIEKLVGDLRDVDNLRRGLLQELAHDLRTPVSSMKSLLEGLQFQSEKMTKEQRSENVEMSLKEVEYFYHLVEDLLFLSGVHDLKYRGKFAVVDVSDVVQHEVAVLSEMHKSINIAFTYDQFYFVKADHHLFQRLMKNALSNAVENAKERVTINLFGSDRELIITISNDGNQLTPEDIATFGKKRATRKISDNVSGKISVGLGAVIMSKICEIHSADMTIENNSDLSGGVTLRFAFSLIKHT